MGTCILVDELLHLPTGFTLVTVSVIKNALLFTKKIFPQAYHLTLFTRGSLVKDKRVGICFQITKTNDLFIDMEKRVTNCIQQAWCVCMGE